MAIAPMVLPIRPPRKLWELVWEYAETVANEHLEMNLGEVAKMLGVGRRTLCRMIVKHRARDRVAP